VTVYRCIYQTTNGAYTTDITVEDMQDGDIKEFTSHLAERVLEADYVTLGDGPKDRTILVRSHIVAVIIKEVEQT
jgi:hypothetical protein